jgi:DNA repair photolyase
MANFPTIRAAEAPRGRRLHRSIETSLTLFPAAAPNGFGEPLGASPPPPANDRSLKPAVGLVGIARLAASSPLANSKRGTEYFLLPVRSILNRCDSPRVPFGWTVNPYRGCEFGCRYCFARYTHEFMELDGGEFERKIYVKNDARALVARDLEQKRIGNEHIAVGTATDPYQPAEQEYRVTRNILEKMAEREGLSLSITTKSNRVSQDIALLQRIAARSSITVNLSVTTVHARLARMLEPRAPRPDLRLDAVRRLREAGIAAGVFAMPILPGITDSESDLDALARAAHDVKALWLGAAVLFLMPSALRQFLPFIESRFPNLAKQYREWYVRQGGTPEPYRAEIAERMRRLRDRYGLGSRPERVQGNSNASPQMALALGNTGWPCAAR